MRPNGTTVDCCVHEFGEHGFDNSPERIARDAEHRRILERAVGGDDE